MEDEQQTVSPSSLSLQKRDPIKSSVHDVAAQRRRQHAVTIGKERRDALVRAKRLCRDGIVNDGGASAEGSMIIDEEQTALNNQTTHAINELSSAISYIGKGSAHKKVEALRNLRRLLSKSDVPPIEVAIQAGAVPLLLQCLSFGSLDEQLLEAAWCFTNIAAGESEQTRSILPALPLLIAHLGEKSSAPVSEQCAWALGNVAGEGPDMRNILLSQGALLPLARMMQCDKGSTARTSAWALSNLIKGPDPKAATELIKINGVLEAIIRHLKKTDEELATEVAWVVVYLSALSQSATSMLLKNGVISILVERLQGSESDGDHHQSPRVFPRVLRSLGNFVAGDSYTINTILVVGQNITNNVISALVKCMKSDHRVLKKEAAWVLSNIAAGSIEHKQLTYSSEATMVLLHLLSTATFDIRKEAAYALGNLCVTPMESQKQPSIITDHLVSIVERGCLPGFINLVRSPDIEAAKLGLQFLELVLRGMPDGQGPKLVEKEDGIEAMERFQFHENEDMRNMANGLVDKYLGEDYGLDD